MIPITITCAVNDPLLKRNNAKLFWVEEMSIYSSCTWHSSMKIKGSVWNTFLSNLSPLFSRAFREGFLFSLMIL